MVFPKSKSMTQRKNLDLFLLVADWQLLHFMSMNLVFRWNSHRPELEVCLGTDENVKEENKVSQIHPSQQYFYPIALFVVPQ